jgi:hypothetical protein
LPRPLLPPPPPRKKSQLKCRLNDKARIHIELNKDPKTIEAAVQEEITFMETTKYPQHDDEQYFNKRRFVRQVTRTEKDTPQ